MRGGQSCQDGIGDAKRNIVVHKQASEALGRNRLMHNAPLAAHIEAPTQPTMIPGLISLLINLDRSPQRLERMVARLEHHQLAWRRVSAIEGRLLDLKTEKRVCVQSYARKHGKDLNPAEVGCYLSHLKCMEQFLADPDVQYALVLEDDVDFDDDFTALLSEIISHSHDWDMVTLSGFHTGTPVGGIQLRGGRKLSPMLSRHTGAAAYLVNRKAAQAYLDKLLPMAVPYDHAFDQGWRLGIKTRLVHPHPTKLDWAPTTIGDPLDRYRKFPWHKRFGTYFYRAGNELQRVAYGLKQWRKSGR